MSAGTTTRRGLLAASAGMLAPLATAVPLATVAPPANAAAPSADADDAVALADPLRTQLLALSCYDAVIAGRALGTGAARRMVDALRQHESAHVTALRAAGAGGPTAPAAGPALDRALARERIRRRPDHLRGTGDALRLLLDVEQLSIGAAYVALGRIHAPARSVLLAQLMASGAQHEALLHLQLHPGSAGSAIPYGIVQGVQ